MIMLYTVKLITLLIYRLVIKKLTLLKKIVNLIYYRIAKVLIITWFGMLTVLISNPLLRFDFA